MVNKNRWFQPASSGRYDELGLCSSSFQILSGGYALTYAVPNNGDGWVETDGPTTLSMTGKPVLRDGTRRRIMQSRNK